jgi:glycosyltransferase involved in cell wall biosynthesis
MLNCLDEEHADKGGGAEIVLRLLVRGLREIGHKIKWVSKDVVDEVLTFSPDIVHIHNVVREWGDISMEDLNWISNNERIKKIFTFHDYANICPLPAMQCDKVDMKRCDNHCGRRVAMGLYNEGMKVAPSKCVADIYELNGFGKVEVVPVGIDTQMFKPNGGRKEYVLFISPCANAWWKGWDNWLKMKGFLESANIPIYELIGTGGYEKMPVIYNKAKLLLLLSERGNEVFGITLIEAMACGTPILAYKTGSYTEIVDNGRTGILIDKGKKQQMDDAIINMYTEDIKRQELGNNARLRAERYYDYRIMTKRYEDLYRRQLDG